MAEELGNVSQACKIFGYSRDSFYRYRELFEAGGEVALHEISRKKPILKNWIEPEIETAVVEMATLNPVFGQLELVMSFGNRVFSFHQRVYDVSGYGMIWKPLRSVLRHLKPDLLGEGMVLTEAQVIALERAKEEKTVHGEIETHHLGYLGAQDTYYVGIIN